NFIVTWSSRDWQQGDTSSTAIKARIFDADGNEVVSEFRANEFTFGGQSNPSVTELANGHFVVTWQSSDQQQGDTSLAIKARTFDANGTGVVGEFRVNEFTDRKQEFPSVTALANGNFVVTWQSFDQQQEDTHQAAIKARILDADGNEITSEFVVNEFHHLTQSNPNVTALADGNFVVTWQSFDGQQGDASNFAIKARIFDANGSEVVTEFLVNEFTNTAQIDPSVTALANGGFVVTWTSSDREQGDTSFGAIKARIFDANGVEIVSEFLVNEFTTLSQSQPSVTALANGDFVVTWTSSDRQQGDTSNTAIKARVFDANGVAKSPNPVTEDVVTLIDTATLLANDSDVDGDALTVIEVSALSAHGATLTLNTDGTISYDPTGADDVQALAESQTLTDTFTYTVKDGDGSESTATISVVVHGRNEAPIHGTDGDDTLTGNAGDDTLYGHAGNDTLNGGAGDDILNGGDGNDRLNGEDGNDDLRGGAGDDILRGGAGADSLDGGAGRDAVVYGFATSGVTVDLGNAGANTGDAAGDVFISIEDLAGSTHADTLRGDGANNSLWGSGGNDSLDGRAGDDYLYGKAGNDILSGGAGNDWMYGGAGADSLDGGAGRDGAAYGFATSGVTVDLANAGANTGDAAGDVLISIENLAGSTHADTLSGDGANNGLWGGAGDDILNGGDGNDRLNGEDGNDDLRGGAGDDILRGGAGADSLDGGAGRDAVVYGFATSGVTVDLGNAGANTGDAAGDVFISIEDLAGSTHADTLRGDGANNSLWGSGGNDSLDGRAGDDYLYGEAGNDILSGGAGNDWMYGGAGADSLDGGAGRDGAAYGFATSGVTVDLANAGANTGDAAGDVFVSIENLAGSTHADTLRGDGANNSLWGSGGNDSLDGRAGDDYLYGEAGNDSLWGNDGDDILNGGAGNDTLRGGAGSDVFVFSSFGHDTIQDFEDGIDLIRVDIAGVSYSDLSTFVNAGVTPNGEVVIDHRIDVSGHGTITLNGFDVTDLTEDDFLFG
ncbi:cadherin-like domain-containing protein, partial [uncultured Ruegeria sp.]|uniref:calcium-binding protein n=2 Tax=uncultured Ruegeria sp. TaxID=259304 RepID=UPI002631D286